MQRIEYDPCSDYYEHLAALPHATPAELLRAYRAAVKQHHPDAGGDPSGRKLRAVCEAYSVLGDSAKRAYYNASRNRFGGPVAYPARRRQRRRRPPRVRRVAAIAAMALVTVVGVLLLAAVVAGLNKRISGRSRADHDRGNTEHASRHLNRESGPSGGVRFGYATPLEPHTAPDSEY